MLAYLFWHQPEEHTQIDAYEQALVGFHRSLAARPPIGFSGSLCHRVAELPWLPGERSYEDWYLIEDYAALGVLSEAAVAHGHRSTHEQVARGFGVGNGGLYRLQEGGPRPELARIAVWVTPARSTSIEAVEALLLGDGSDRAHLGLWRRELVLGPAPEYCLISSQAPAGVASARLPEGWHATLSPRETIWES